MPTTVPTTPTTARVLAAAATGVATAAYYATPDVIRSRTARGWTKAGLSVALVAASLPDFRRTQEAARAQRDALPEEERVDLREVAAEMPPRLKVAAAVAGAGVLAGTVASVVAVERWIFRRGEARLAAGTPYAHTRTAVVLGLLGGVLALVPDPSEHPAR